MLTRKSGPRVVFVRGEHPLMFWFQLVVVVALLAAVGWLAVGGGGHMSEPEPDRPDLALPGDRFIGARDLDRVRFSVGVRGYRMDEVDDVLDRLAREVEVREQRIAELEGRAPGDQPTGVAAGDPVTEGVAFDGASVESASVEGESVVSATNESGALATADPLTSEFEDPAYVNQPASQDLPPLPES
jgi:DivIVA domain-containing protein